MDVDHNLVPDVDASGPRRMLSIQQVLEIIPVSESTLIRMVRSGQFPPRRSISANRCEWYADEVQAWQKALPVNDNSNCRARRRPQQV